MSVDARYNSPSMPPLQASRQLLPDVLGLGGAIAGLGAGIAMALVGLLIALATGTDIWLTPKLIAATLLGPAAAAQPGFAAVPVLLGTLMHLGVAVVLGAVFGVFTRRVFGLPSGFGIPMVSGMIYGLGIWLIAYFIVLPLANPTLLSIYAPGFIIQNLVYGTVLGLLYGMLRP